MPVPAEGDLKQALDVARGAIEHVSGRAQDREIELFFKSANGGAITLLTRFWIESTDEVAYLRAKSDAIESIRHGFDTRPAQGTKTVQPAS
jgi:hypothetical protein